MDRLAIALNNVEVARSARCHDVSEPRCGGTLPTSCRRRPLPRAPAPGQVVARMHHRHDLASSPALSASTEFDGADVADDAQPWHDGEQRRGRHTRHDAARR